MPKAHTRAHTHTPVLIMTYKVYKYAFLKSLLLSY